MVGLVLLVISASMGGDSDVDTDVDFDTDVDVDFDTDADAADAAGGGGTAILQWLSIKALAIAAVGFGFVGWATTVGGSPSVVVWLSSIAIGLIVWAFGVLLLFPWLRRQQGHDLSPSSAYQGLRAEVVVRIPAGGMGTVQFADPSGAVVRRTARSVDRSSDLAVGKPVVIVLATEEHVTVDEFSVIEPT